MAPFVSTLTVCGRPVFAGGGSTPVGSKSALQQIKVLTFDYSLQEQQDLQEKRMEASSHSTKAFVSNSSCQSFSKVLIQIQQPSHKQHGKHSR